MQKAKAQSDDHFTPTKSQVHEISMHHGLGGDSCMHRVSRPERNQRAGGEGTQGSYLKKSLGCSAPCVLEVMANDKTDNDIYGCFLTGSFRLILAFLLKLEVISLIKYGHVILP